MGMKTKKSLNNLARLRTPTLFVPCIVFLIWHCVQCDFAKQCEKRWAFATRVSRANSPVSLNFCDFFYWIHTASITQNSSWNVQHFMISRWSQQTDRMHCKQWNTSHESKISCDVQHEDWVHIGHIVANPQPSATSQLPVLLACDFNPEWVSCCLHMSFQCWQEIYGWQIQLSCCCTID